MDLLLVERVSVVYPDLCRGTSPGSWDLQSQGDSMRLLVVSGRLDWSVPTTYALSMVRGLLQRGHEIQMVCRGGVFMPLFRSLGIEVYENPSSWLARRKMQGFLQEFDPHLIHATGGPGSLRISNRLSAALDTPFVHTVHSWLRSERSARSTRSAAAVVVVNQDLREHLVNELGIVKDKIRVIPYGIEVANSDHEPKGFSGIPVIGTVGRLEKGRRLDDFIEAAAFLRKTSGDKMFTILGEGPDETRLRGFSKSLDMDGVLTFAAPPADPDSVYRAVDLLMLVSDWGGSGLHLLEGLARGVPTIATGGGEILSLLGEEGICTLVKPGDPEALAEAGRELLADPEKAQRQASKGIEHVREHFPMRTMLDKLEALHENLSTQSTS